MKKPVAAILGSALFALTLTAFPAPGELQALNRKLVETLSGSLAEAEYSFLPDKNGKRPELSVGYLCPNCNSMHYTTGEEYLEEERPFKVPAYALSPRVFISSDIGMRPEWLAGLELSFRGKKYPVKITAYYPGRKSVRLETESDVAGVVPLKFSPKAEGDRYAFFRVTEKGIPLAGIRPWQDQAVTRELVSGKEFVPTAANVLIVNAAGEVIALSMQARQIPGEGVTPPPSEWKGVPAETFEQEIKSFASVLEKNIYPVAIRLRPQRQLTGVAARYRRGNNEEERNEVNCIAIKLRDGRVLVNAALSPAETARLQKITLQAESKEIAVRFEGSLRHFGAFTAVPEEKLPGEGIPFFEGDGATLSGMPVFNVKAENYDGALDLAVIPGTVEAFSVGFRGMVVPESSRRQGGCFFTRDGVLLTFPMERRKLERERYSSRSDTQEVAAAMVSTLLRNFDPNNVPRQGEEKIAYLGVEYQVLDEELARANNASSYTRNGEEGLLVSFV